jgi:hypothetical protein
VDEGGAVAQTLARALPLTMASARTMPQTLALPMP